MSFPHIQLTMHIFVFSFNRLCCQLLTQLRLNLVPNVSIASEAPTPVPRNHFFFFLSGFSCTSTDNLQDSRGMEETIFYSTLPLPPVHEHSDIYLQLCMWDDYHIFLIAALVFTRLLLDEIYHFIELLFDWLMIWCWFLFVCLLNWFLFVTGVWNEKSVDSNSHRLSSLYYKRTD